MKTNFYSLILISIIFSVFTATQAQPAATGNPGQLVNQLEADLATAKSTQVDVLSPNFYKDAESALLKAKQGLEKGTQNICHQPVCCRRQCQFEESKRDRPGLPDNPA